MGLIGLIPHPLLCVTIQDVLYRAMITRHSTVVTPLIIVIFQYYTTGVGDEMAISKALGVNKFILKFSLNWKNGGARNAADRHIMRNNDISRQKRQGQL